MRKIDDVVDASFDGWPNDGAGIEKTASDLALSFAGLTFLPAQVIKILSDQFAPARRFSRIEYLFTSIRLKLKQLESEISKADTEFRKKLGDIQERIETRQFERAVAIAAEEAARGADEKTIDRLASVAVGALKPEAWWGPPEDVSTLIRDIAQLSDTDILVLRELSVAMANVGGPNFNLVNGYTGNMQQLRDAIKRTELHDDDFYAVCSRLTGFGLAMEEARNVSRMAPHERCFRPTHRGVTILGYLEKYKLSE